MNLVSVYTEPKSADVLYRLMAERPEESFISHTTLPMFKDHERFIGSRPFLHWYLVEVDGRFVGALECTDRNEVGISIFEQFKRRGYASEALKQFLSTHSPLPAIPAIRNGCWLANVATNNAVSENFFRKHGFITIQRTMAKK